MRGVGKRYVVALHFVPDCQTLLVFAQLVVMFDQFLLTSFYGEVSLSDGDYLLSWVAVHYDQIAGIAGKMVIGNGSRCTRTNGHHFADVRKMVIYIITAICACKLCTRNGFVQISPLGIIQYLLKLPCALVFLTVLVNVLDAVKGGFRIFRDFRMRSLLSYGEFSDSINVN